MTDEIQTVDAIEIEIPDAEHSSIEKFHISPYVPKYIINLTNS